MTRRIARFEPALFHAQGVEPGWMAGRGSVLENPRLGVYLVRVALMDGERILYDQVLRAERGGGVFVPIDGRGRVGLQPVWRPQAREPERYTASLPDVDLAGLGRISYEVPRGFSERGEPSERAAAREAAEETRGRVVEVQALGPICDNTAFSPHLSVATWGSMDLSDAAGVDEPSEGILGRIAFFSRRELLALQREGKLYDGLTLAALALLWMQRPDMLDGTGR